MTFYDFTSTAHGKWILTGEHAVVRGGAAIAFPIVSKNMTLNYCIGTNAASANFNGNGSQEIESLFWRTIQHGLQLVNATDFSLTGTFYFDNNIPIGAGMGASAALCTNIARWLCWQQLLTDDDIFNLARELENLFHGKSSGLDIAAAMHTHGIYFNQTLTSLQKNWQPQWFLSYSGECGITANCVDKVMQLWQRNPILAQQLDAQMQDSVALAVTALQDPSPQGLLNLTQAINIANQCFAQWGLADGKVAQHIKELLAAGALAVKPTGSGDGGYVLSLWDKQLPPQNWQQQMIKV